MLDMITVIPLQQKYVKDGRKKCNTPCLQPKTFKEKLKILKGFPDSPLKDIIGRSLNNDPSKRPEAKEILRTAQKQLLKHA